MVDKTKLTCPQCLHHNQLNASKCELCDWPLQPAADETRMADMITKEADPEQTIAPGADTIKKFSTENHRPENPDPDSTVSPQVLAQQKQTVAQTKTLSLAGDLAHFEIHEILGQGGMGAVYHAKDRTLQRDVAIKMLRPLAASSQFNTAALLEEARMASKLNHPNIVTIYDVARADDSNYIVMEWVDGQSLDELIPEDGLELTQALEYACQIANGLSSAHQKYIIHRDIKPQNIMLSAENAIKILDFGIAGLVSHQHEVEEDHKGSIEKPSTGTPSFMSPEQAQGMNLDQRSDIFSFGIVLYQMLCGQRPFVATEQKSVKAAICAGQYIPIQQHLPDLPQNVVKLLEKMLATKKDERWQSSTELATALHEINAELTYKKNWWQRRHWFSKVAILIPFVLALGWSAKDILFPVSTQQLIERQLAEATKIAILPFENISGDPLIQLFGDGLAVNLGSDLAAIASEQNNTWIVPATEISRMEDQSLKAVADKYGVNLVLTGSIQHMGSTRLLVLNLLNAANGQQVKTTEVSINADELFQGHGLIRAQALELLGWTVPPDMEAKFNAQRPQMDGAYKEYVQGMGYLYRYDQVGNLDKALESFQSAINIDETYQLPFVGLAEVYYNLFLKSKDIKWLDNISIVIDKLKVINPDNFQINYLSAELAIKKGEYDNAIQLYQASIAQNSGHVMSHIGLANAIYSTGNFNQAEKIYLEALAMAPNNWRVVSDIGIFYFENGNYRESLKYFQKITAMSPNNLYGYRLLAASYYSLGELENAILFTRQAINIKPSDVAYVNLGTMLFSIKEYEDSIKAYTKATELSDSDYINWGNLADAYKITNNLKSIESYKKATVRALKVLKTNPNDTMVKADLAYYFANLNEEKDAHKYASQIGGANTGLENFVVAQAYDLLKLNDDVLRHLKIAIKKNYSLEEIINTPLLENVKKDERFKALVNIN